MQGSGRIEEHRSGDMKKKAGSIILGIVDIIKKKCGANAGQKIR